MAGRGSGDYLLIDTAVSGKPGGTGVAADWSELTQGLSRVGRDHLPPILLAGGLRPECVGQAIRTVAPSGVDVCSGVELSPGRKDRAAVEAFVEAVRLAQGNGED